MRKVGFLLGVVLLASLTAAAQDAPKADVCFGYSYIRANPHTSGAPSLNLNGGSASVAYYPTSSFGIVGDFGGYHVGTVSDVSVNSNLYTYLLGPRLVYRGKVTPYAQVLFGGAHATRTAIGATGSRNSFAMSAGLDVKATEHIGMRLAQVDYLLARFRETGPRVTQNNSRLSTGIVFGWSPPLPAHREKGPGCAPSPSRFGLIYC